MAWYVSGSQPEPERHLLGKLNAEGRVPAPKHGTIVCTLTGHGLKDPDRAVSGFQWIDPLPAELSALMDQMN